jgi:hypothetical protein
MTLRLAVFAAFALLVGTWGSEASAWGDSGHRLVCEIALRNLTPTAKAEVERLLAANAAVHAGNPQATQLGWACTYPDHPAAGGHGRRSPEHFANYPRSLVAVAAASGCGAVPKCVVTAIASDWLKLASTTETDAERAWSLVYLGHWVGDIHQPLHNSFADDRGGNEINVTGLCSSNLHSTWDTCILTNRLQLGSDPPVPVLQSIAATWSAQVSDIDRAAWLSSRPWQWSAESYLVTLAPQTTYCAVGVGGCRYSTGRLTWAEGVQRRSQTVNAAYMDWAMPIIQRRITQSGIRLAHLLNLALDPAYRVVNQN